MCQWTASSSWHLISRPRVGAWSVSANHDTVQAVKSMSFSHIWFSRTARGQAHLSSRECVLFQGKISPPSTIRTLPHPGTDTFGVHSMDGGFSEPRGYVTPSWQTFKLKPVDSVIRFLLVLRGREAQRNLTYAQISASGTSRSRVLGTQPGQLC